MDENVSEGGEDSVSSVFGTEYTGLGISVTTLFIPLRLADLGRVSVVVWKVFADGATLNDLLLSSRLLKEELIEGFEDDWATASSKTHSSGRVTSFHLIGLGTTVFDLSMSVWKRRVSPLGLWLKALVANAETIVL
ncbi:hypothetical protein CRG98_049727 [Punica granatum]|uniref:Uncharacterized protein n=1 Tax=Punica granatum TaxID=22663 RepID=A0A2I0H3E8_PUNGR|nr:hypothetical protein CRG98_049727 [Punica granatum]